MKTIHLLRLIVGIVALWGVTTASAQTTAASGTVLVIPNAGSTPTFSNEISVHNPRKTVVRSRSTCCFTRRTARHRPDCTRAHSSF